MKILQCTECDRKIKQFDEGQDLMHCPHCGGDLIRVYPPLKLGEILVLFGWIQENQLEKALEIQTRLHKEYPLGKVLVRMGTVQPDQVDQAVWFQRSSYLA